MTVPSLVQRGAAAETSGKEAARQIFLEALAAIDVTHAMWRCIKGDGDRLLAGNSAFSLASPPRVVALGKAANRMAATLHAILEGRVSRGVVVSPALPATRLDRFEYFAGGHPYPNADSFAGVRAALELLKGLAPDDCVIFLISGGGSALFELPLDPAISLADLIAFNRLLVTCGMPIEQMNVLRKHLSAVKGGRLTLAAWPAKQLTIYLSDVPDNFPSMVASGPTMPDESVAEDCYRIAEAFGLTPKLPVSMKKLFENRAIEETPKPDDRRFLGSQYFRLLSNQDALEAAKSAAEKRGFVAAISAESSNIEFREAAVRHLRELATLESAHPGEPVALIAGGEVISRVTGKGMGGRNQAYTLAAAQLIEGRKITVLSAGTDGRDGNSPSSGAVADGQTLARARTRNLDAMQTLADCDSYYFFRSLGDTLDTGFMDNNVRDVRVWLAYPER